MMKRTGAIVALALGGIMSPAAAQVGVSAKVTAYPQQDKHAVLNVLNFDPDERMNVKVQNSSGLVLFSESFKTKKPYHKLFDFSKAEMGTYFIDVVYDGEVNREVLEVGEEELIVKNAIAEAKSFHKRILKNNDGEYTVLFMNKLEEPVTLRILDAQGETLHEDKNIDDPYFFKKYNLTQLDEGMYAFSLSTRSHNYRYDIDLRK